MYTSWLITCVLSHWFPGLIILYHAYFLLDITIVYLVTYCLSACSCMSVLTTRFSIHDFRFRFIDTHVPDYARHLAFIIPLVGEFLTLLDLHVQIPEFEACGFSQLLIRDAQRKCRSSADLLKPYPSGPPARL